MRMVDVFREFKKHTWTKVSNGQVIVQISDGQVSTHGIEKKCVPSRDILFQVARC